jgi:cytoskeleton protein RodZ
MTSIGETLRRERLRRGWDLEQVARETRIGQHLLQAIEADQFDRLPGGVFARNFVRQYARMLELDVEGIIADFKHQFEEPPEPPPAEPERPPFRLPRVPPLEDFRQRLGPGSFVSAFVSLVLVILGCAGLYTYWLKGRGARVKPRTAAALQKPPVVVAPTPVKKPSVAADTPKPDFRPAELSENGTIRVPDKPAPQPAAAAPAARTAEVFPAAMRVAFTATEPVWVSIKSDGTRTYTGTIEVQERRQFNASRKMTVLVGNAGSLEISLNGKPVGPIGPRGEIRLLVLTPQGAHVVPRTPPTPPPTSETPTAPAAAAERP